MKHNEDAAREVHTYAHERPSWITPEVWRGLSWRERDYIVLQRKGVSTKQMMRKLYFGTDRALRYFAQKLRNKLQ